MLYTTSEWKKSQLQLTFRQLALTNNLHQSPHLKKNEFLFVPKKTPLQGHSREGQNFPRPALDTELFFMHLDAKYHRSMNLLVASNCNMENGRIHMFQMEIHQSGGQVLGAFGLTVVFCFYVPLLYLNNIYSDTWGRFLHVRPNIGTRDTTWHRNSWIFAVRCLEHCCW